MQQISMPMLRELAARASNSNNKTDVEFAELTPYSTGISLVLARRLQDCVVWELARSPSDCFADLQSEALRRSFLHNLLRCAVHDYHRQSSTHLFFGHYSSNLTIKSFHSFKDKAFEGYLMSCSRLASVNDEGKIREWNSYLEGRASEDINTIVPMGGEAPCSGVVNFKIDPVVAGAWDNLVLQMAASLNKVSRFVLDKSIPLLDNYWCQLGNDGMAKSIRQYANPESTRYWRQYTVRVPQETHGVLIGIGHELRVSTSTISTFAFNKFLSGDLC